MNRWFGYFGGLTPGTIENLIGQLTPHQLDERRDPERFTPREVVAHMADFDAIFLSWIKLAVDSPGSQIENWDEDELAAKNDYASTDVQEQLERLKQARAEATTYVRALSKEQLEQASVCQYRGPMSVEDQCGFWLGHDLYHIEQLSAYLKLPVA